MTNKMVCFLQSKQTEKVVFAKLTPEQKELRQSCSDADTSKFFVKDDDPMPLVYRKAGFTQYRTKSGNVMYQTPCGKKCHQVVVNAVNICRKFCMPGQI